MINMFSWSVIVCLLAFSGKIVPCQVKKEQRSISGEGVVVAFQQKSRHSVTPAIGGIATPVEYWIIRIDRWAERTDKGQQYILVQFNLHERAVSDSEINSSRLRFSLRPRLTNEHTDCLGRVFAGGRRSSETRPAKLSDYQRTKVGGADKIPPLKSLPCFITDEPPVVVEGKN